jgi:hypothetical protein
MLIGTGNNYPQILSHLTLRDLHRFLILSHHIRDTILSSPRLLRIMFRLPSATGPIIPMSNKVTLGRFRNPRVSIEPSRHVTVWARKPCIPPEMLQSHIVRGRSDRLPAAQLLRICQDSMVGPPVLNPTLQGGVNRPSHVINMKESPVSHAEMALRLVPHSVLPMAPDDTRRKMLVTQPPVLDVVVSRSDTMWGLYEVHNEKGVTLGDILDMEAKTYGGGEHIYSSTDQTTRFVAWSGEGGG